MMPILDDFECSECLAVQEGWRDDPPLCCDKTMQKVMRRINHFEWGGPRTIRTCRDEPFTSRAEHRAWMKENNLQEAGDPVHGARNEDHRNMGKLYSYPGAPRRSRVGADIKGESWT